MTGSAAPVEHPGWEHFPHDADVGVRGFGKTAAEAFEQAARALTAVITHAEIEPRVRVEVCCEAPDIELLFVEWLNAVIYEMAVVRCCSGALPWGSRMSIQRNDVGRAGRCRAACPGLRGERCDLHGAEGNRGQERTLVRGMRRGRVAEREHGSRSLHARRCHHVACRAARENAGPGDHLCRRRPHPRHGRQGLRAGNQRRDPAWDRPGVLCHAGRPLGLRLPDRRSSGLRSGPGWRRVGRRRRFRYLVRRANDADGALGRGHPLRPEGARRLLFDQIPAGLGSKGAITSMPSTWMRCSPAEPAGRSSAAGERCEIWRGSRNRARCPAPSRRTFPSVPRSGSAAKWER